MKFSGKKNLTAGQFVNQLSSSALALADIAEAFREIEMIFFTHEQRPAYLAKICSELKNTQTMSFSMPDFLPPAALRINYEYKRDAVWKEIRKEEKVIPKAFEKRGKNLLQVRLRYLESFPGMLTAYWQRQQNFYQSQMPGISPQREEKQPVLKLSVKEAAFKKELVIQFELYKELLCSSPEITAELIAQKLSNNRDLTAELAGELLLAVFVGRDISYCLPGGSPKLLPVIEKYIAHLGQICHSLHQVLHPAPPPINGLRRHSAPGLSVFQEQPPTKTHLITMQLTTEEAQLIAEFRKNEFKLK